MWIKTIPNCCGRSLCSLPKTVILLVSRTVDYALAKLLNKEVGSKALAETASSAEEKLESDTTTRKLANMFSRAIGKILRMNGERCPSGNRSVHIWMHSQDPKDPICEPRRPKSLAAFFTPGGS